MCGIIGYFGTRSAPPLLVKALKTLEYRGYDSWGIAIKHGKEIKLHKKVGKIGEETKVPFAGVETTIGIGHTRWATHGSVTDANAHPHFSTDEKVAVVHNGVVENYQEIRENLQKQGFKFRSDTDTEVIPLLIENYMKKGLTLYDAFKLTLKDLVGRYAIVVLCAESNEIIAARNGSPLVVGQGYNETFIASDMPAFLDHTKKVIYLKDHDIVRITSSETTIFNLEDNMLVKREVDTIEWDAEQAKKGDFKHFMIKEILEQVEVVERTLSRDMTEIEDFAKEIKSADKVLMVACGTASYACMAASYIFAKVAKISANVISGAEFKYFADFITPKTVVIAVSQSGETADVLESIQAAKEKGAKILAVINVRGSTITRASDKVVITQAGPEICVLSTKAYTAQVLVLSLIAHAVAGTLKEGTENAKDLIKNLYNLTSKSMRDYIQQLAERLRYSQHLFLIGRNLQYPTAIESALKIKEVSYIHAEAFAGGDLKHGTIALIEYGTPCIVFTSEDTEQEVLINAAEVKARGGYIIGVGPNNNELFDFYVKVREADEFNSICQVIPMQILAYQLALLRGKDPDKPRNLAKSVVVK